MILKILILALLIIGLMTDTASPDNSTTNRFFYSGDGTIHLVSRKNGKSFRGIYRERHGKYSIEAYKEISAVFDAPYQATRQVLSLRLIEFIDYLEDQLAPGALLTITSGYRPPKYNTKLRKRGGLAAKTSLHQYGMAVDLILEGVSSKRIWEYVQSIKFGGTGYYHGEMVHVDVGPARFWDEKTSGVGTGLSDDNKLIGIVTDYDVYGPGDSVTLTFIRMTAFPIKVQADFQLIPRENPGKVERIVSFRPESETLALDGCSEFNDINQMASFRWRLPSNVPPGRYSIRAGFCGNMWERMPKDISTPEFEIR